MKLDRLAVVHVRKAPGVPLPSQRTERDATLFSVETCLRLFWVGVGESFDASGLAQRFGGHILRGTDAYRLLLEIGCGLESEIPGESEVFGQFRAAWKRFQEQQKAAAVALEPFVQRLLEDIKDIRTRHLQGHGGATYGSLTRLLLGPDVHEPTLLVGAGKMARAIVSYLSGRPLFLWNRTPERLDELTNALGSNPPDAQNIRRLPSDPAAELGAWAEARTIILCVPPDAARDRERLATWQRCTQRGRIFHFGILSTAGTSWNGVQALNTLQDLFKLRDARNELRLVPLARARDACQEKARLRSLGGSASLAHGWEDLSSFTLSA